MDMRISICYFLKQIFGLKTCAIRQMSFSVSNFVQKQKLLFILNDVSQQDQRMVLKLITNYNNWLQ